MPRKVDSNHIDQIDEILQHEDPNFIADLSSMDADAFKLAELEAAFADEEKKNTRLSRFFEDVSPVALWSIIGGGLALVALISFSVWYLLQPAKPLGSMGSLQAIADETYIFDVKAPPKDLLKEFIVKEYLLEITDQTFYLKPARGISAGRFGLNVEVATESELVKAEKNRDEIIEILSNVFRGATVDDFNGIEGKEAFKLKMLRALNGKLGIHFKNVRYSLMVFN